MVWRKKSFFQHARIAGKSAQPAWTFGAAKIARSGGLKRNRNRVAPLHWFFGKPCILVAGHHFRSVPKAAWRQFAYQVDGIVPVEIHEGQR